MKNLYKISFIIALFTTVAISAQEKLKGNKEVTTENRKISNFSSIEVIDNIDVELIFSNNQSVTVETDSNLQSAINTEVSNDVLTIKLNAKILRKKELKVTVKVNSDLKNIFTYNNSKVLSKNSLNIDSLAINTFDNSDIDLKLNSKLITINAKKTSDLKFEILSDLLVIRNEESASIKATINTNSIETTILDRSNLDLTGNTNNLNLEALGNSSFKGKDLETNTTFVNASNNAKAYIQCVESIDISTKNSAEIFIYSNPKITITEFFDKSSIHKKEL